MSSPLTMIARLSPKPDKVEELRHILKSFVEPTRRERGCISYNLHEIDSVEGIVFVFYEVWRSQDDHQQHDKTPWISEFTAVAQEYLRCPEQVERLRMLSALPTT